MTRTHSTATVDYGGGHLATAVDIVGGPDGDSLIGQKTASESLSVVLASDQAAMTSGTVASGAADSGNPVKVGGVYNATAPTLGDGERGDAQIDANGNLKVAIAAEEVRSFFDALGADVDISVKATAGYLMSIVVTNINAAVRYVQLHDKATAPANPDVPIMSIPISAGSATLATTLILGEEFFGKGGRECTTGIAIGVSTTGNTFTAATASDHYISGSFV